MTENTVLIGRPGSGLTRRAQKITAEHTAAGGHVIHVTGLDASGLQTALELVQSRRGAVERAERLGLPDGYDNFTPLLIVIDPADDLSPEQWNSVSLIVRLGRREGVTVVATAHRITSVPSFVRDCVTVTELTAANAA